MSQFWTLEWPRGRLILHSAGGMLSDLSLFLDDGREVEPLYRAPWLGEPDAPKEGVLANLRGEFVCLPYGAPAGIGDSPLPDSLQPEDLDLHGYPAAAQWHLIDASQSHLSIGLEFPERNALARLVRTVRVDPQGAFVDLELMIEARRACRRSIAFHPSFALPRAAGAFEIEPDGFLFGMMQPEGPEAALSNAVPGSQFNSLEGVTLAGGGEERFDRLPLPGEREDVLMLCGVEGGVSLNDHALGVVYRLEWDAQQLPCLVLWISNRGRKHHPWNGRNLCVGVEPCRSAFGGILASLADNPVGGRGVATAIDIHPGEPLRLGYRISASALPGWGERP